MQITATDIDNLIEVSSWLKSMAGSDEGSEFAARFMNMSQRTRKVYILLLQASEHGQLELKRICGKGIPDDDNIAKAIRALCPLATQDGT